MRRSCLAAVPMLLWAGDALAGVTADQLWQAARDFLAAEGITVSATERREGGALVLTGGRVGLGDGLVLALPDVTLADDGNGEVTVTLPERFPLVLTLPPEPGAPAEVTLDVAAAGLELRMRDLSADVLDFDLSADTLSATLAPVPTTAAQEARGEMTLALADLTLQHLHRVAEPEAMVDSRGGLGTLHADLRVDVPSEGGRASLVLDLSDLQHEVTGQVPPGTAPVIERLDSQGDADLAGLMDLLDLGLGLEARLVHGPMAFAFDGPLEGTEGRIDMAIGVEGGTTALRLDRNGVLYDAETGRTDIRYKGDDPDIPLPEFEAAIGNYRLLARLDFPGADGGRSDGGDWALIYRVAGVAFSPGLWSLADPDGIFPHDPMTLSLDLGGSYVLDPALLEPGWTPDPAAPPPLRELTLVLNEVLMSGLGASTLGEGEFALDLSRMATVDDLPEGKGTLSFVTEGANALIDRLSQAGALTADEVQAARLGLLFLGRLEGGADRLVTRLDLDGKSVTLNGQRIR